MWTGNLQAGLGEPSGDAAFRRSFSALNLSVIAARENAAPFLSQDEFDKFLSTMLDYLAREKDTRGFKAKASAKAAKPVAAAAPDTTADQ